MTDATQMLLEIASESVPRDEGQEEHLLLLVYDQLRGDAAALLRKERRDHTLQPTALVHEAYLRLIDGARVDIVGRTHFLRLAACAMRRILVDHARQRLALKRGGDRSRLPLSTTIAADEGPSFDLLDLHEALERLARRHERPAQVVEMRYFGGMSIEETSTALEVSERTVVGDWTLAQAWLRRDLSARAEP